PARGLRHRRTRTARARGAQQAPARLRAHRRPATRRHGDCALRPGSRRPPRPRTQPGAPRECGARGGQFDRILPAVHGGAGARRPTRALVPGHADARPRHQAGERVNHTDAVIVGGGLAGLTLALQLRARLPALAITVLERDAHPAPEAAHKVGESTVEIGAHYLDTVLGLDAHLRQRQLRKFGFRFFFSDRRDDIDAVTELGASNYLHTPGYQIDRGILENFLCERVREQGIELITGATVREIALADDGPHRVRYESEGADSELAADWLVDASGRAGLLR